MDTKPTTCWIMYVSQFKYRLYKTCNLTHEKVKETQYKMKTWFDKKSRERVCNVGDRVLVLLPIPGKFCGPCTIDKKVYDVNYIVCTPDRRKTCQHVEGLSC